MSNRESIYKGIMRFRLENTKYIIKYVKRSSNDVLLDRLRNAGKDGIKDEAFKWANEHNDEFGNRFVIELHDVFWDKVWYNIRKK